MDTPTLAYTSVHNGRILGGDDGLGSAIAVGRVFAVTASNFEVLVEDPLLVRPRGVAAFPPETPALNAATLVVRVDSPINVLVTDAAGHRIGHDAAGNTVNDFGTLGAILALGPEGHPRVYAVINPAEGDYAVQAVGTDAGPYTIRGYRADTAAGGSQAMITGTAAPGVAESLTVNLSPGLGIAFRRPCRADFDVDGDVDGDDVAAFEVCARGPSVAMDAGCEGKDFDGDVDGDQSDFGIVQRCYSGEGNPADPNCACPSGQTDCDGTCLSTQSDDANCGTCGNVCAAGTTCENGTCAVCPGGATDCGGACVDLMWDSGNCGACGSVCPDQTACAWGVCEGICIGCQ